MAYLELTMEAYEDVLNAAGNRRGQVALKINELGVFETTPAEEEVAVAEPEVEPEVETPTEAATEECAEEEPERRSFVAEEPND